MMARPVSRFPSVKRDLAFVVEEKVPAGSLLKFLREHGGEFLETVEIFDLYQGNQIGKGQKSLAFSLNFQAPERTLTEAEVDATLRRLVDGAGSTFGAHLRT
jgi:phenylalanyl-tRNA synthetase beta chain